MSQHKLLVKSLAYIVAQKYLLQGYTLRILLQLQLWTKVPGTVMQYS